MDSLIIFLISVATLSMQVDVVASTVEDDLKEQILHNYDKTAYPENDLRLVYDVFYTACPTPDPTTGALVSQLREKQQWEDERLKWSPRNFNVREINISPNDVWKPAVTIDSSIGRELSATGERLKLTYRGELDRTRNLEVSSNCERVNGGWKCQLRFVAYEYYGESFTMETQPIIQEIQPNLCGPEVKIEDYQTGIQEMAGYYYFVIDFVVLSQ